MRHLEEVCFAPGIGSTLKERAGEGKGVVGPVSERREPMQEKDSGVKDLPGASSISGFRERLTRKEVALEVEVGSGSGGETQERAGAGEGVVGPVSKEEEAGEEG